MYKEIKKLKPKNNSIYNWANALNRQFSKYDRHKYMMKCPTSLAIKEMQIIKTLRFHLTTIRMAIIQKTSNKWW
jgi:hypothetical protein